jgi:acyl carrier protein
VRGYRVEPGEIEGELLRHPAVKEAVVVERRDEGDETYLCAYYVSAEALEVSVLREFLSKSLPAYMIPSYFVPLSEFPLHVSGKVARQLLPEPEPVVGGYYVAPSSEIERRLVEIWSGVLSVGPQTLGVTANFFELGGHSLKATVVVSRIHKELHVKVPLIEIFKTPTIRGLSRYIISACEDKYAAIEPVEKREYYRLLSA